VSPPVGPGLRGKPPTKNEFGALQKATGGNNFVYSECHVLQLNDQNVALANMSVSDCISLSPKGVGGGGAGSAPSISATKLIDTAP